MRAVLFCGLERTGRPGGTALGELGLEKPLRREDGAVIWGPLLLMQGCRRAVNRQALTWFWACTGGAVEPSSVRGREVPESLTVLTWHTRMVSEPTCVDG